MLNVKFAKKHLWSLGVIKDLKNSSSDKVTNARCYDQNKYWGSTKAKITTDWMQPTINNFTKNMQRPIFTMVRMQPTLKTTSIYVQQ